MAQLQSLPPAEPELPTPPANDAPAAAPRQNPAKSTAATSYLILYNFISAILWTVVFGRVVALLAMKGLAGHTLAYRVVGRWTKWTQTLAAMEVVHASTGLVRASPITTLVQVSSRFVLVWGAIQFYPLAAVNSYAYISMLLAWSTTEIIRYSFFALSLSGIEPAWLKWLRYSSFIVLYPLGISSELWEIFVAGSLAYVNGNMTHVWILVAVMAIYIPGAPVMIGHMASQRRKILGGDGRGARAKKSQ